MTRPLAFSFSWDKSVLGRHLAVTPWGVVVDTPQARVVILPVLAKDRRRRIDTRSRCHQYSMAISIASRYSNRKNIHPRDKCV